MCKSWHIPANNHANHKLLCNLQSSKGSSDDDRQAVFTSQKHVLLGGTSGSFYISS